MSWVSKGKTAMLLAKGFYEWEGCPVRIMHDYGWPELFDGVRWKDLPDCNISKFLHGANQVSEQQGQAHVELRKQQHAEWQSSQFAQHLPIGE